MRASLVGVLAGGIGRRMGGRDKAELRTLGGETLLSRLQRVTTDARLSLVVVGGAPRQGMCVLEDDPPGIGPLGGLRALFVHAGPRPVLALACDLPYVSAELIAYLARAPSSAPVLAPRDPETGKWQPLFARYDSARLLPSLEAALASGVRSFQAWFGSQPVHELILTPEEHALLRDWDEPGDIAAG